MRLRLVFGVGFAAGYYLGAKAGRERYEQLRSLVGRLGAGVELLAERFRGDAGEQLVLDLNVLDRPYASNAN